MTIKLNETFSAGEHRIPSTAAATPRFEPVLDAFMENYRREDEVGSAVSVVVDGRTVVDLWGGWRDAARQREWQHDTIVCMMSVSKGITGLAFSLLVDRGLVDVDAPVARYWPEFASNGKETLPVRFVLDHRAGLPDRRRPAVARGHLRPPGHLQGTRRAGAAVGAGNRRRLSRPHPGLSAGGDRAPRHRQDRRRIPARRDRRCRWRPTS